ncbi:helix-turn-helix domain-containing protein [Halorubrum sp. SY-15]|uniref:helix-turn-helix domain-containing protein n=1 Tax=Halorubrum sp. SY-15 TaxID=3402277 RepID=UPI003EBF342E
MSLRDDLRAGFDAFIGSDGSHSLSNSTVLVVDPTPDVQTIAGDDADRVTLLCEPTAEAGMAHVDAGRVDCVVSECDSIGVEAIDFLALVRDVTPELPVVFYTERDSALTRAKLLDAGATEYYVKTTDPDSRAEIGASIRGCALAYHHQYSTKPRLTDYERFGELTGNTFAAHDLRTGRNVQLGNLRELGYDTDGESWEIEEIFQLLHPSDVERVGTKHAAVLGLQPDVFDELTDEFGQFSEEIRLRRADGSYAPFIMRGVVLLEDGIPSLMLNTVVSITDGVKRQWRESSAELLFSTGSVRTAATRACRTLCESNDCAGAWVVSTMTPDVTSDLEVLAVEGACPLAPDEGDSLVRDPATDHLVETITAPAGARVAAAAADDHEERSHESTDHETRDQLLHTETVSTETGTVHLTSVTITHAAVTYGTVTVAQETPPTDLFLEGLRSIAASLAYRYGIETQENALTSDVVTRVSLSLTGDHALAALSSAPELDGATLDVTPIDEGSASSSRYLVAASDPSVTRADLERRAKALDAVVDVEPVESKGPVSMVTVAVASPTLVRDVRRHAGMVQSVEAVGGTVTLVVDLPRHTPVGTFVEQIRDAHPGVRLAAKEQVDTDDRLPLAVDSLTEKQHRALEVATRAGFFDRPQVATADEVGDLLGVSRTTALRHIRIAERKLLSVVFGGTEREPTTAVQ